MKMRGEELSAQGNSIKTKHPSNPNMYRTVFSLSPFVITMIDTISHLQNLALHD